MIRQDYLLRMIEQAAQALAKLFGLQSSGKLAEAGSLSRDLSQQWLGLTPDELGALDDAELLEHLQRRGSPVEFPLRLGLTISLLRAEAGRHAAGGDSHAARCARSNALCLLLRAHILNVAPDLPEFTPRLADLQAELPLEEMPLAAAVLMMCFHEHLGQFGQAEDVLFALRDREGVHDEIRELGREFFGRLQCRTDSELAAGNLPRAEVEAGLASWLANI